VARERLDDWSTWSSLSAVRHFACTRTGGARWIGSQLLGHEAQLYEGANFVFEQGRRKFDRRRRSCRRAAGSVFVIDADFIVKNGVKRTYSKFVMRFGFRADRAVAFAEGQDARPEPNIFSQK